MTNQRTLAIIHFVLGVMVPVLISFFVGCREDMQGTPVDYGAEVPSDTVQQALMSPVKMTDPLSMQIGEFVAYSDTQDISNGAASNLVADTSQTITDRVETTDRVTYTIIQHQYSYGNGAPRKVSTEINSAFAKPTPVPTATPIATASPTATPGASASKFLGVEEILNVHSDSELPVLPFQWSSGTPLHVLQAVLQKDTPQTRVTYHNLVQSSTRVPAPDNVQRRPNCLGLVNCQLDVYQISFDRITWTGDSPEKVHFDFWIAPQAPYLASIYNKCATLLVPFGGTRVLLRQCSPVNDFIFSDPGVAN